MEGMQERGKHVKGLKKKIGEACKKAGLDFAPSFYMKYFFMNVWLSEDVFGTQFYFRIYTSFNRDLVFSLEREEND
jgi:hypothetical protein